MQTPIGVTLTNEKKPWQHLLRRIFRPIRALLPKKEQRDHRSVPLPEISTYLQTMQAAVDLARDGQVSEGRQCLLGELKRARTLREGQPWAAKLAGGYREALDIYDQRFGLKAGE